MNKQKIKSIIPLLILTLILGVITIFYQNINYFMENLLCTRFNIVYEESNLLVHFISVGQGDAVAINLPDDKILLIDTGPMNNNVSFTSYLEDNVINGNMNREIDYLILTHADADHIGGTLRLLKNFKINNIYMPKIASKSNVYENLLQYVEENCNYSYIGKDDSIITDEYNLEILNDFGYSDTNSSSTVVRLTYLDKTFLFTGDIESKVEQDYINMYKDSLDCDVLKVSHHGSSDSTSSEFILYTSPEYAVISVGLNNIYNHPDFEVLSRLAEVEAKVLRTDELGDIVFVVSENLGLKCKYGVYTIMDDKFDCRFYSFVFICFVLFNIILIVVKNPNKKIKKN